MKLIDLVEGYHDINKQVYDIGLFVQDVFEEYVGINPEVTIRDYNAFASNPAGVITNILEDVTSTVISKHPNKNMTIYSMNLIGRIKDLPGSILIGNLNTLFDTGGRKIPLIVDNIEESIQEYISNLRPINFPSQEECMTRINRDHKLVTGVLRRKVNLKSVDIEYNIHRGTSTAQVIINPPFGDDLTHDQFVEKYDDLRVKIKKLLEPYGIDLILDIIGMEI